MYVCLCESMCTRVQVSIEARQGHQISLEVELQAAASSPKWVLGTDL